MSPSVPSLFKFQQGDHCCVMYENDEALLDFLAPYIAEGLGKNERVFCVQRAVMIAKIKSRLEQMGIAVQKEIARGALKLHTEDDFYPVGGRLEPEMLMSGLEASIAEAVEQGFSGYRTAGDLSWAGRGDVDCNKLIDYEQRVEDSFARRPVVGVCQYPIKRFSPDVLKRVFDTHRLAVQDAMAGAQHSTMSVRVGDFTADVVANRTNPDNFYFVIQKTGHKEIEAWGAERSFDAALSAGRMAIQQVAAKRVAGIPL